MPKRSNHPNMIQLPSGIWKYKRRVPTHLRAAVGREFWEQSLGTKDDKDAAIRARQLAATHDAEIARIERLIARGEDVASAIATKLGPDPRTGRERTIVPRFPVVGPDGEGDWEADWTQRRRETFTPTPATEVKRLLDRITALQAKASDDGPRIVESDGVKIDVSLQRRKQLVSELAQLIDLAEANAVPVPDVAKASVPKKQTLTAVAEMITTEKEKKYADQIKWSVRLFNGIVGEKDLTELVKSDLATFEREVARMPVSTNIRNRILAGRMSASEAVASGAKPTYTPKAVQKHVSFIKSLTSFAEGKGLMTTDPFASFRVTQAKKVSVQKDFTTRELDAIFGAMEEHWLSSNPDRVWISLLSLYHGIRREEACQLLKNDVRQVDGVWCLDITTTFEADDDEDADLSKRLKTDSAKRLVPVHPVIIDARFLGFVELGKGPRLFASLTPDSDGRLGGNFGKRFAELMRDKAGVEGRRIKTFHSFRHTAITAMRNASFPEHIKDALSGHATGTVNAGYGSAAEVKVRAEWVAKLKHESKAVASVLAKLKVGASSGRRPD